MEAGAKDRTFRISPLLVAAEGREKPSFPDLETSQWPFRTRHLAEMPGSFMRNALAYAGKSGRRVVAAFIAIRQSPMA